MNIRRPAHLSALVLIAFVLALPAAAQPPSPGPTPDLAQEIASLKKSVESMQRDLQEIKTLLLTRPAGGPPANVAIDIRKNPARGDAGAKLVLVEFSDFQCPFCGRYARETFPQLEKDYIETGKVRYVFLDLPLESIHKFAFKAAEAASCAAEQGKFWEMHDRLFANQGALEDFKPHAQAVGLDMPRFDDCLASGRQVPEIRRDMAEAAKVGITGTPGFFLGYVDPKTSLVRSVASLKGAQPYDAFKTQIDKLLADQAKVGGVKPGAP